MTARGHGAYLATPCQLNWNFVFNAELVDAVFAPTQEWCSQNGASIAVPGQQRIQVAHKMFRTIVVRRASMDSQRDQVRCIRRMHERRKCQKGISPGDFISKFLTRSRKPDDVQRNCIVASDCLCALLLLLVDGLPVVDEYTSDIVPSLTVERYTARRIDAPTEQYKCFHLLLFTTRRSQGLLHRAL